MTKRGMRGFAVGLWLAAVVMAYFYVTDHNETKKATSDSATVTEKQVKDFLKNKGQVIIDQKTYKSLQPSAKKLKNQKDREKDRSRSKGDTSNDQDVTKETMPEKIVHSIDLKIERGMSATKVCEMLADAQMIKSAQTLKNYLQDHQLSQKVQIGTFHLTTDMSIAGIAKKIT